MQDSGEIVYGVCLPATGFSALFVVISLITVISILVSGFVCYQRQLQKVAEEAAPKAVPPTAQQVKRRKTKKIGSLINALTIYCL